jgi:hypothetical protein
MFIKIKRILPVLFLSLFLLTCKKDHEFDCLKSTGNEVTIYREARPFTNLDLKDNVDVILHTDTSFFIRVTAGEHLIDGIITELSGNTLYIRNENRCNWMRSFKNKYTVEIGMNQPEKIASYGSGSIVCKDTIRTSDFSYDSWNASGNINLLVNVTNLHLANNTGRIDLRVAGRAEVSFEYINDTGVFDGSELITNYTYIGNSSTGDCHVHVEREFSAGITHTGNIYYSGNPYRVDKLGNGSGKLIHI